MDKLNAWFGKKGQVFNAEDGFWMDAFFFGWPLAGDDQDAFEEYVDGWEDADYEPGRYTPFAVVNPQWDDDARDLSAALTSQNGGLLLVDGQSGAVVHGETGSVLPFADSVDALQVRAPQ